MSKGYFHDFQKTLEAGDTLALLRKGLVGEGVMVEGPMGPKKMIYADYIASGRALMQVEWAVLNDILPYYANSHTEGSLCGATMTRLRREARAFIAGECGVDERHAVIFTGSGATSALNRIVGLLGVNDAVARDEAPLVLIGPYEHHSNILPWRESGAEVIEIPEAVNGGPDMQALEAALKGGQGRLMVGSFSAASNVSGIVTDVTEVTRLLKRHGALAVWDYAGGGPYLTVDMAAGTDAEIDAVALSPHKFVGGPGASGVLIVRKAAVTHKRPTITTGGGTVRFVSPWGHDYLQDVIAREEAGTPNVIGDIRAGLVFAVKAAIGQDRLDARHDTLRQRALDAWHGLPGLQIMGNPEADRALPFFSIRLVDETGKDRLHPLLLTRILSDCFGIQARGGCACAGPYGHRLLGIDEETSEAIRARILKGDAMLKPGWTRFNLSALMNDEKADKVIDAIRLIAFNPERYAALYSFDAAAGDFTLRRKSAA
ncbi:MAG: aminotransferase class V-fold PLP-dependent enzyme [Marivivens sp.]